MPIRLVDVDHIQNTPDNQRGQHCHSVHEAILVRAGRYQARVGAHEWGVQPGQIVYYPAGVVHEPRYSADGQLQLWYCSWSDSDPSGRSTAAVLDDQPGRLSTLWAWMWSLQPGATTADRRELARVFALWHIELQRQLGQLDATPATRIDHIRTYLAQNLHRNLDLAEVARTVPCSTEHLIRTFKRATGQTPYQYLQQRRIDQARQLLIATDLSLAAVAERVGYQSVSRLHAVMKRATGRTPGQWRTSAVAG